MPEELGCVLDFIDNERYTAGAEKELPPLTGLFCCQWDIQTNIGMIREKTVQQAGFAGLARTGEQQRRALRIDS